VRVFVDVQAAVDLQRLLVKRLSLGKLTLSSEDDRQVAEEAGREGVVALEAASNLQRLLEQRLGLDLLTL
jgi:hypothetical protein